jgi:hypothetical protein
MSLMGLVGKGIWGTAKGIGKTTSRALFGIVDGLGVSRIPVLNPVRQRARRGLSGLAYHLGRDTTTAVRRGVTATTQAAIMGMRGFSRIATRPARPGSTGNVFNRELKPWAVASLAFLTLAKGLDTANQLTAASSIEYNPRTDPTMLGNYDMPYYKMRTKDGENPIFMQDAGHNYSNMGATGDLALALYKNRHG